MVLSRDPCNFQQDDLEIVVLSSFENLLHDKSKKHFYNKTSSILKPSCIFLRLSWLNTSEFWKIN
jgi:hypothetical protein